MDILDWFLEETQAQTTGVCSSIDGLLSSKRPKTEKDLRTYRSMICDTVNSLRSDLQEGMVELSQSLGTYWPVHRIRVHDLLRIIRTEAGIVLPVEVHVRDQPVEDALLGEPFTLVQTVIVLIGLLHAEHDVHSVLCFSGGNIQDVSLEISWRGEPVPENVLAAWRLRAVVGGKEDPVLRIRDVFKRHQAWWHSDQDYAGLAWLRIVFPHAPVQEADLEASGEQAQPMYDFALLDRNPEAQASEDHALTDLMYTVFDLETTGLDVRSGDEIVAIAGVRVVNGRIVAHELFEQLVNPGRPVPQEAVRVHGLDSERLQNKPGIEEVLPLFYKFAEGTVLVAHCADFDLGFLRAREQGSGIRFTNPVLDTFKLSVLVHPTKKKHDLESIAARLGTRAYSRHEAMGDAWTTAEILLQLFPLLAKQGITTLRQAVEAGQGAKNAQLNLASVSVGKDDFREA